MIAEKISLTRRILQGKANARASSADFLNEVYSYLHGNDKPDFKKFNTESWTRAWRKVLESDPTLDEREDKNAGKAKQVKKELGYKVKKED